MKAALEQLGFGRCYHMAEIFNAPWRAEAWTQYFQGGPMDWDKVFEGFGATVDAPACLAWRSLADRYPAAKIVLTVRDREAWCESMLNTVLSERHQSSIMGAPLAPMFQAMNGPFMQVAGVPPTQGEPPPGPPPREVLYALYEGQRAAVREGVPAERLLEFDVREGWEPLCRFLGVEAPPTSFPRVNDSGTFHDHFSPAVAAEA